MENECLCPILIGMFVAQRDCVTHIVIIIAPDRTCRERTQEILTQAQVWYFCSDSLTFFRSFRFRLLPFVFGFFSVKTIQSHTSECVTEVASE